MRESRPSAATASAARIRVSRRESCASTAPLPRSSCATTAPAPAAVPPAVLPPAPAGRGAAPGSPACGRTARRRPRDDRSAGTAATRPPIRGCRASARLRRRASARRRWLRAAGGRSARSPTPARRRTRASAARGSPASTTTDRIAALGQPAGESQTDEAAADDQHISLSVSACSRRLPLSHAWRLVDLRSIRCLAAAPRNDQHLINAHIFGAARCLRSAPAGSGAICRVVGLVCKPFFRLAETGTVYDTRRVISDALPERPTHRGRCAASMPIGWATGSNSQAALKHEGIRR